MPTVTDSNDNLGVDMTVEYTADPGFLSVTTQLSGRLGISLGQIDVNTSQIVSALTGGGADQLADSIGIDADRSMTVNYRLEQGAQAQLEDALGRLVNITGVPLDRILGVGGASASDIVPSEFQNFPSDTVGLWTGFRDPTGIVPFGEGFRIGGSDPASVNRVFRYNPVTIRLPQRAQDRVEELPPLRIEVIARPTSGGTQAFFGGDLRATIEVPPEDIIDIQDLEELSCGDRYPNIEESINGISTEIDALLSQRDVLGEVGTDPQTLMVDGGFFGGVFGGGGDDEEEDDDGGGGGGGFFSGVRDAVRNRTRGGITGDEDTSVVGGGITGDPDTNIREGGLTGDEDTSIVGGGITGDEDTSIVGGGITGDADTSVTEGGLTGDEDTNVFDEGFTRDEDTSVFDRQEGDPASTETDVTTVPQSSFQEARAPAIDDSQIDTLDLEGPFFDQLQTLLTEVNSLESTVTTEVDVQSCRQEYLGTLEGLRGLLRDSLNLRERVVDCGSDYSAIQRRISNLESRVRGADPTDPRELSSILSEAGNLQSDISSQVESNECLQEFRDRVNGLVNRLENFQGGINCIQEYSDLDDRIEDIRDRAFDLDPQADLSQLPPLSEATDLLEEARNIRSDINERVDDPECFNELKSRLQGAISRLENVKSTVDIDCASEFPQLNREVTSVIETADRLRTLEDAGELVSERDAEGLEGSIEAARNQIDRIVDVDKCASEFRTRMDDAEGILRDELDPRPDLSCDDISSDIRTSVESLRQEAAQFSDRVPRESTLNNARQFIEDARNLRSRVEEETREANPCRSTLLSDLDTALERLQAFSQREPVPVPCSEKFPELNQESKDLQATASEIRGVVGPQEILDFIENADSLEKRIEDQVEQGDRCRDRLLSRIDASVKRVQSSVGGLRSITEGEAGDLLPGIDIEDFEGDIGEIEGPELEEIRSRIEEARAQ